MDMQAVDAINRTNECIENLERGIQILRELPDGLCGVNRMHVGDGSGSVFISAAYDLKMYRRNRRALYDDGWRISDAFVSAGGTGDRHAWLEKDNQRIIYVMDTDAPGSTCKRIMVGEVVKAVYKVSCQ